MRNGILGLMGEIVVKVLCKEDLDDAAKKLRDQLLDKMEVSVQYIALCCDKETVDSLSKPQTLTIL